MSQAATEVILDLIRGRGLGLGGFSVRRVLPIGHRKMVGPFIAGGDGVHPSAAGLTHAGVAPDLAGYFFDA